MKNIILAMCLSIALPTQVLAHGTEDSNHKSDINHKSQPKRISYKHQRLRTTINHLTIRAQNVSFIGMSSIGKAVAHNISHHKISHAVEKKLTGITKLNDVVHSALSDKTLSEPPSFAQLKATQKHQAACLALTVYHEDRGSTIADQKATALVVMNRVHAEDGKVFGSTVCQVVSQKRPGADQLQFSWLAMSTKQLVPKEPDAWYAAQKISAQVITGSTEDITNGALYFWCPKKAKRSAWMKHGISYKKIGAHIYMRTAHALQ